MLPRVLLCLRRCSIPVLLAVVMTVSFNMGVPVAATSFSSEIVAHQAFTTNDGGLAVLGNRYAFVGTSFDAHNTLYIYDLVRHRLFTQWHLPTLRGANSINRAYTMDELVISPNLRWLYIVNHMRADVVAIDLTGHLSPRSIGFDNLTPDELAISPDGRSLYVSCTSLLTGNDETVLYDTSTGTVMKQLPASTSLVIGRDGSVYRMLVSGGTARVWVYREGSQSGQLWIAIHGSDLDATTGSLALNPAGTRLYVLWHGLRTLDTHTGRVLRRLSLPLYPQYTKISVSPNGQQAMLWSPDFVQWIDTPTDNPHYIAVHYGFVPGALLPVNLSAMKPLMVDLPDFPALHAVAYTADSRFVVLGQVSTLDVLRSGTSGPSSTNFPTLESEPPSAIAGTTKTGTLGTGCAKNDLTGSWQYTDPRVNGNLTMTLRQTGSSLVGTFPWQHLV